MAVQHGRSQVRDAKNNERHVCGRRRGGEPAVPEGESYTFHPPAPSLPRQALFPWPYDEPLSAARTKLADFFNILLGMRMKRRCQENIRLFELHGGTTDQIGLR